jgi:predicted RNA polymerase sigma factor
MSRFTLYIFVLLALVTKSAYTTCALQVVTTPNVKIASLYCAPRKGIAIPSVHIERAVADRTKAGVMVSLASSSAVMHVLDHEHVS